MKSFLFLILLFSAHPGFSQVERDVVDLNDQIRQNILTRSYDQRILLRVKNQLENILLTLDSGAPTPGSDTAVINLKCVAQDNDNSAPWIFAAELSDFTLKRFREHSFRSLQSCQARAQTARVLVGGLHTCVSRDNDDSAPFVIATFVNDRTFKRPEGFTTLASCQSVLGRARVSVDAWMFCAARDNDNSAPWIRVVVKRDQTSIRQTESTFQTLESCQAL